VQDIKLKAEVNRGLHPLLAEIKTIYANNIAWNTLYSELSNDKKVLQFAWRDSNVVLFMSNFHTGRGFVERERKRPGGTSKGMNVVKKAFGNKAKMTALIPDFIDGYNHGMNGVDLFDQSRKAYESLRKCFKTWKPRWHFFLDIAQCNSFRLSAYSPNDDNPAFKKYRNNRRAHYTYIKELCISLLQMGIDARRAKRPSPALIRQPLKNVATISIEHHKIMKAEKRLECVACKAATRSAK
jgi:hypothetical protein